MYWRGALGYDEATEVNIALSLNGLYGNDKSGVAYYVPESLPFKPTFLYS